MVYISHSPVEMFHWLCVYIRGLKHKLLRGQN